MFSIGVQEFRFEAAEPTVKVISAIPLKNICNDAKKRKPAYKWALSMPSGAMWVRRNRVAQIMLVNAACTSVHIVAQSRTLNIFVNQEQYSVKNNHENNQHSGLIMIVPT